MKKTVKPILGAAVALAMTASGAFADPIVINSLPIEIDQPGDYHLQLPPDAPQVQGSWAIIISSSNVSLDLNGNSVDCWGGIMVVNWGTHLNNISIKNGTFNGIQDSVNGGPNAVAYSGIQIFNADHVSVENVNFNGKFAYNADWGTYDSIKNCGFESPLAIDNGGAGTGHGTYENLTVSENLLQWGTTGGYPNSNDPTAHRALYSSGQYNSFKNVRILSGNVYLTGLKDAYDHFYDKAPSTVIGGTNLKPGK